MRTLAHAFNHPLTHHNNGNTLFSPIKQVLLNKSNFIHTLISIIKMPCSSYNEH